MATTWLRDRVLERLEDTESVAPHLPHGERTLAGVARAMGWSRSRLGNRLAKPDRIQLWELNLLASKLGVRMSWLLETAPDPLLS